MRLPVCRDEFPLWHLASSDWARAEVVRRRWAETERLKRLLDDE